MAKREFDPMHPGVVLAEDFLKGMEISQCRLAKGVGVPPRRINMYLRKRNPRTTCLYSAASMIVKFALRLRCL